MTDVLSEEELAEIVRLAKKSLRMGPGLETTGRRCEKAFDTLLAHIRALHIAPQEVSDTSGEIYGTLRSLERAFEQAIEMSFSSRVTFHRSRAVRLLEKIQAALSVKEKKPLCSVYHARAVGVACSNCGHPKEAHSSQKYQAALSVKEKKNG